MQMRDRLWRHAEAYPPIGSSVLAGLVSVLLVHGVYELARAFGTGFVAAGILSVVMGIAAAAVIVGGRGGRSPDIALAVAVMAVGVLFTAGARFLIPWLVSGGIGN